MGNPPPTETITPISDAARAKSLRETLARTPDPGTIRIFGYGSLMWNPCFDAVSQEKGILRGYHRGFSIWSVFARGTPEHPGLGFALEQKRGAVCEGILFTLPEDTTEADLLPLWEREMWTSTYRAVWVDVTVAGRVSPALTFVVDTDHFQYAGDLPLEEKARYIAAAAGKYGTCYDYLAETVREMQAHGIHDPDIEALMRAVDDCAGSR